MQQLLEQNARMLKMLEQEGAQPQPTVQITNENRVGLKRESPSLIDLEHKKKELARVIAVLTMLAVWLCLEFGALSLAFGLWG